ncbi:MAG TPA: acyltransferase [Thermomicrobiales bacterium]|nr:acyltransferase [Thermomicrobiales bacterium]
MVARASADPVTVERAQHPAAVARPPAPKLEALTSLRFFAAAMIVILHTRGFFGVPETVLSAFTLGQGVTFFFVLSGFILAYVYPSLDRRGTRRFLVARVARIWPLHATAFLLFFVAVPLGAAPVPGSKTPGIALLNLALLHAWIPANRYNFSFNAPSWSISVEFFFYACFPLLIARWRRTWAVKLGLALGLALAAVLVANYGLHRLPAGVTVTGLVYNYPLARLWEFTLGIATARLWRHLRPRLSLSRFRGTLLELAALGVVLLVMYQSLAWTLAVRRRWNIGDGGFLWVLETGFIAVPFAVMIGVLAFERGWASRVLAWSPLVLLGEISYSIYLLHTLILLAILYRPARFARVPPRDMYALYWLIVLLAAYLSWSVIEQPVRRVVVAWWDRRFAHTPPPTRASTPAMPRARRVPGLTTPTWRRSLAAVCALLCIGAVLFA